MRTTLGWFGSRGVVVFVRCQLVVILHIECEHREPQDYPLGQQRHPRASSDEQLVQNVVLVAVVVVVVQGSLQSELAQVGNHHPQQAHKEQLGHPVEVAQGGVDRRCGHALGFSDRPRTTGCVSV